MHDPSDAGGLIEVTRRSGVQILRINRPKKKNALTDAMYRALTEAMAAAEADDAIGAHLFTGVQGVFTAGNDIGDFIARASGAGGLGAGVSGFLTMLAEARKPMVAAVDGLAIGIGTTMLWQCDLVYASPGARFATPFIDLGLVPENGSSLIAPRLMGHQRAFEMLCLGEGWDAARAHAAGWVNAIVPAERLEAHALDVAARLAAKPRTALIESRRLLRGDPAERLAAMRREAALFAERIASPEARAAFTAFMNRKGG
ncbi:MAG: crotonase/enoyl-CoA hydratase family protein [Alphaproteobacteria bacterium]|nr:MAG: crotonase/enoyl-CoA hydratase family protein [Alphaproteobacteria bacterium]